MVASIDERRNVPAFIWAGGDAPPRAAAVSHESAARFHMHRYADVYGLSNAALATAYVNNCIDTGRGGVVVRVRQRVDGLPVYNTELKLIMTRDYELVALAGNLHPAAVDGASSRRLPFNVSEERAIAVAVADASSVTFNPADLIQVSRDLAGFEVLEPKAGNIEFGRPARVRRVYYPSGQVLVPAFEVEIDLAAPDSSDLTAYAYVIDAAKATVVERRSLTQSESFDYRVWADTTAPNSPPMDGPNGDTTPHPVGTPEPLAPGFVDPVIVSTNGFNTNPDGASDPWLPADAEETVGNNVDAYADHNKPDGFSDGDLRASLTSARTFDRVYDVAVEPDFSNGQMMAAVTQIFYTTNWLHDWFYDSGFDEAAGNAQQDNYGRGGVGGDPLLAEAQDTGGDEKNNANMSTFGDGSSPRMQMFLWSGPMEDVGETVLEVTAPESIAGTYNVQEAQFGPDIPLLASGEVVLVEDEIDVATDGCDDIVTDLTGKIALIDRGQCMFVTKVLYAQDAGAIGVIIANTWCGEKSCDDNAESKPDDLPPLGGTNASAVTVVVLGVSFNTRVTFETGLAETLQTRMSKAGEVEGLRRDGSIDNGLVAHEWGHYIHGRLVRCGTTPQWAGQAEGWGDFVAVSMMMREGDNLDGLYAIGGYSTANVRDSSHYFGIRRAPYSVDFEKNALTFRHISLGEELPDHPMQDRLSQENAFAHKVGEIWAIMLHEVHVALLKESEAETPRLTWDQAHRRMGDYVVAGMAAAPSCPTFTQQRDAILAAAAAADKHDFRIMAEAFARRGAGTGAKSPPRDSEDLIGVVESYHVQGDLSFAGAEFGDVVTSCDHDGVLDARETGTLSVSLLNSGADTLTAAKGIVATATAGVSFPNGGELDFGEVEPFDVAVADIDVALDASVEGISTIELSIELADPAAVIPSIEADLSLRVNYDELAETSATDTVESEVVVWSIESGEDFGEQEPWRRALEPGTANHVLLGRDPGAPADERIVTPELEVGDEPFVVTLQHRFKFEASKDGLGGGEPTHRDGAVIEISTDGGSTWSDVSDFADPAYNGTIADQSGNPLGGRLGFVDESAGYPNFAELSLDFGDQFAGQTVLLRFRIGADATAGAAGWELDDIEFAGITNTPFSSLGDDTCVGNPDPSDDGGCGCTTGTGSGRSGLLWLGVALLALRRRR